MSDHFIKAVLKTKVKFSPEEKLILLEIADDISVNNLYTEEKGLYSLYLSEVYSGRGETVILAEKIGVSIDKIRKAKKNLINSGILLDGENSSRFYINLPALGFPNLTKEMISHE